MQPGKGSGSLDELRGLAATVPADEVARTQVFTEMNQNIGFLLLTRK